MPDSFAPVRLGEKRPVYGQISASSGTLTISASPAPVCTLFDSDGNAVSGMTNITATGYETGALAAPKVWLNLDTNSPTVLGAGYYTLVFTVTAAGSDGITRVLKPSAEFQVIDDRA